MAALELLDELGDDRAQGDGPVGVRDGTRLGAAREAADLVDPAHQLAQGLARIFGHGRPNPPGRRSGRGRACGGGPAPDAPGAAPATGLGRCGEVLFGRSRGLRAGEPGRAG